MPKPKRNTQTIQLTGAPEALEIKQVFPSRKRFTSISPITTELSYRREPDLLDLMGELSKGARDLFLDIKRNMNFRTHLAVLPTKELTRSQINKRSVFIKELEKAGKGLACRVPTRGITNLDGVEQRYRRSTFMLSPEYIFPGRHFEEQINWIWEQCFAAASRRHLRTKNSETTSTENQHKKDDESHNVKATGPLGSSAF